MKKILFLAALPLVFLASGCSISKNNDNTKPLVNNNAINTASNSICEIPVSSSTATTDIKTVLPPVSQEEQNKTFTYEDVDMGVKMKYPGSCYFNKGVFQCSDFTLSIWLLDPGTKISSTPVKTYANGQTQLQYTYSHKNQVYALMAWYDGQDKADLDQMIGKIASTLSFTK